MSKNEEKLLRSLFYGAGGGYYEVIDNDGFRKPAIRTWLADTEKSTKEHGFDREIWCVSISWRLLAKWFGGGNDKRI